MEELKDPKLWAAFELYCQWNSLPRHYATYSLDELEKKGLPTELAELAQLKSKKDFGEKYLISLSMLNDWDKHPQLQEFVKKSWKNWCKKMTPGVIARFHDKLMEEGDAARMKLWLQVIEEENGTEDKNVNINLGIENIIKKMESNGEKL